MIGNLFDGPELVPCFGSQASPFVSQVKSSNTKRTRWIYVGPYHLPSFANFLVLCSALTKDLIINTITITQIVLANMFRTCLHRFGMVRRYP